MIVLIGVLFFVGIIAILLEAVLPFGISATIGSGVIIFSGYLAISKYGAGLGSIYCIIALIVALLTARFVIKTGLTRLSLKPPEAKGTASAGRVQKEPGLGETCRVVKPLRPTGEIEWEGRRLPARTLRPEQEIAVGARVKIESKESIFWLVTESKDDSASQRSEREEASAPPPSGGAGE